MIRGAMASALVGLGATFVVASFFSAMVFELYFRGAFETVGPLPRSPGGFLTLQHAVGAWAASSLGGWRAIAMLLAFAGVSLLLAVAQPAMACIRVGGTECSAEMLARPLTDLGWSALGLIAGHAAATARRVRAPLPAGLAGAAAFPLAGAAGWASYVMTHYVVCFTYPFVTCQGASDAARLLAYLAAGIAGAAILRRLGGGALDALVVGGYLLVTHMSVPLRQGAGALGEGLLIGLAFNALPIGLAAFILGSVAPFGRERLCKSKPMVIEHMFVR